MATYGMFNNHNAIIEMASASGITLVDQNQTSIFKSNTFGTGQVILDAINRGVKNIYIGIGGSATNDGIMTLDYALGNAETLCYNGFYRLLKTVQAGINISKQQ